MGWPYHFLSLSDDEIVARRQSLDLHARYGLLSALVPLAIALLYQASLLVATRVTPKRGAYAAVPDSPRLKEKRLTVAGSWSITWRRTIWWLGDDIVFWGLNWGQWDQMIVAVTWTSWLVFLCVVGTGDDYAHITKRFGIVAISQMPIQYLMSLKNINPFAFAFCTSHEKVNRWHRVLGRIIYGMLVIHAGLYLNMYVQNGILNQRLRQAVPLLGFAATGGLHLLNATALSSVRHYSYRLFFITHLGVAIALPPVIYFHARHSAIYVVSPLVFFFINIAKQKYETIKADTKIEMIPGTDLIKMTASVPPSKINRFRESPGGHVYLNLPAMSRPNTNPVSPAYLVFEFVFSPFTVASVDEKSMELTLVARRHNGPLTQALAQLTKVTSFSSKVPLAIDGPYGYAQKFPSFAGSEFDRILLVAGGVGATFILPIYHLIMNEKPAAKVQLVWALRSAAEATWPLIGSGKSIVDDDNVQLFLTGDLSYGDDGGSAGASDWSEGVELERLRADRSPTTYTPARSYKRPNLQKFVDGQFRHGLEDRVAVLVCGPDSMARELKSHVGFWVRKGRQVWWHDESFSW
ncbi:ferric reductase like transmembrane component [Xylariaceae sp. FL0016]|nr:ferric reductase like transmembrane component [Xylariaceae sp. FL0016]